VVRGGTWNNNPPSLGLGSQGLKRLNQVLQLQTSILDSLFDYGMALALEIIGKQKS